MLAAFLYMASGPACAVSLWFGVSGCPNGSSDQLQRRGARLSCISVCVGTGLGEHGFGQRLKRLKWIWAGSFGQLKWLVLLANPWPTPSCSCSMPKAAPSDTAVPAAGSCKSFSWQDPLSPHSPEE